MKPLTENQLNELTGGMSADACGMVATTAIVACSSGFFGVGLFCAAVYFGAGC
jgi:hypothetical protein